MKQIPFFTFRHMHPPLRNEMTKAFQDFYDSGWYVLGEGLKKFEKSYSQYSGVRHTITVADGLDALVLALQALDIGPGDDVIVPSHTYIATWLAVSQIGANLVPVESDERTFNLKASAIAPAITANTKCIMPVNLYGQACELEDIMSLANRHGIYVVEDNAQSQGATYRTQKTGSFGHANGVSFYPGKNLGALGEAGAVTTNDDNIAKKLTALRNYGSHKKYHNLYLGRNGRMDELQARLLDIKLLHLDDWNQQRQQIAKQYDSALSSSIKIKTPKIDPEAVSVYHQYIVLSEERDALQEHLLNHGVGTMIHYPIPPHLQPAYAHLNWKQGQFPIAEKLANTMLSLPIYPGLTEEEVAYVVKIIQSF